MTACSLIGMAFINELFNSRWNALKPQSYIVRLCKAVLQDCFENGAMCEDDVLPLSPPMFWIGSASSRLILLNGLVAITRSYAASNFE